MSTHSDGVRKVITALEGIMGDINESAKNRVQAAEVLLGTHAYLELQDAEQAEVKA